MLRKQERNKTCLPLVFGKMPGDVNPSFPVARILVEKGHQVYYMSPDYKAAIEDTGATFLDATKYYDLYKEGRTPETFGAANQLKKELQLPDTDGEYMVRVKICHVELEKKLPGLLQAIDEIQATAIVYDPVLAKEAAVAAEICKLPIAALLAFNGHGAWADLVQSKIKNECPGIEDEKERNKKYEAASMCPVNQAATKQLNEKYKDKMKPLDGQFTGGRLDPVPDICLVTTTESMKAAQTPDLVGTSKVNYVGALLDIPGALRAGGPTTKELWKQVEGMMHLKKDGGRTIFVSMGTVATADGDLGWQGHPNSSLTGELLCQAVWGGALDALGECGSDKKNVVLMTVGKDASGAPRPLREGDEASKYVGSDGNALLRPSMPQMDILNQGIDLFITHGGQNSFVESITLQTPMLVLPTVGDQIDNAAKAVQMGIGDKVDRPPPSDEGPKAVAVKYRKEVKDKILQMLEPSNYQKYKDAVVKASSMYRAGGVNESVQVLESLY